MEIFIYTLSEAKEKGHLGTSQRQAIIRLIEKKKITTRVSYKTEDPFLYQM